MVRGQVRPAAREITRTHFVILEAQSSRRRMSQCLHWSAIYDVVAV